jgi:hypothetical protein
MTPPRPKKIPVFVVNEEGQLIECYLTEASEIGPLSTYVGGDSPQPRQEPQAPVSAARQR